MEEDQFEEKIKQKLREDRKLSIRQVRSAAVSYVQLSLTRGADVCGVWLQMKSFGRYAKQEEYDKQLRAEMRKEQKINIQLI